MKRPSYWILFLAQSIGAALILRVGVPFYRRALLRTEELQPLGIYVLVGACVLLIQASYWPGLRSLPASALGGRPAAGHVLIFLGRLCFVFVSSLFSVIYFVRFEDLDPLPGGYVLLSLALFSMFCYARELERLGNAMLAPRSPC